MSTIAATQTQTTDTQKRSISILAVATILAACSIAYELLLAQALSNLAANTVRWYSLAIGFFLVSMGLGAFLYSFVPERVGRMRLLFWIEVALIIVGSGVVAGVHFGHMLFGYLYLQGYDPSSIFIFLVTPIFISTLIGILTGFELPILMDIAKDRGGEGAANEVLACDYFGSLIGSISFPLILLSYFQLFEIGLVVATANFAVAIFIFSRYLWKGVLNWLLQAAALLALGGGLFQLYLYRDPIHMYFLKKYYYYLTAGESLETLLDPMPDMPDVFSEQSPYQRIDVIHDKIGTPEDDVIRLYSTKLEEKPDTLRNRILFLNGDFQTNTLHEEIYHEWFAHVPILLRKKIPKRVLVMGGGDGYLIRELLKYKEIEEIYHIDLDSSLINVAKKHPALLKENEGAFDDPRVTTHYSDGFYFARTTEEKFPAVYIDFPIPNDYNLSKLYSVEFYGFVRRLLTDDGFAVFDGSGIGLVTLPDEDRVQYLSDSADWDVYYNTVKAAGYDVIIPYLSTLGYYDDKVIEKAVDRYDLIQTPVDNIGGIPPSVKRALRKSAIKQILANYVLSLQQGFFMLGKDPAYFQRNYWEPPVHLRVLNRERFEESFLTAFPRREEPDMSKVNSIMLPRFPTTSFWLPRTPW